MKLTITSDIVKKWQEKNNNGQRIKIAQRIEKSD